MYVCVRLCAYVLHNNFLPAMFSWQLKRTSLCIFFSPVSLLRLASLARSLSSLQYRPLFYQRRFPLGVVYTPSINLFAWKSRQDIVVRFAPMLQCLSVGRPRGTKNVPPKDVFDSEIRYGVYVRVCTRAHVYVNLSICKCMHTCIYVCIYIYIYIYREGRRRGRAPPVHT